MRELVRVQEIEISDEALEMRLNNVVAGYASSPEVRKIFDSPQMRGNIRNELVMNHINAHLVAIGMGEDPSALIDDMQSRMAADTERARERRERLQRYREEDAAGGDAEAALMPRLEADAPPDGELAPEGVDANTETGNT